MTSKPGIPLNEPQTTAEILAEAIHPVGGAIAVDCCMGSTVRGVHKDDPEFAEQEHRRYHLQSAERMADNLEKAGYRVVPS